MTCRLPLRSGDPASRASAGSKKRHGLMPKVLAILTAAGESSRMGRPKALLPWRGTTLVEYQVSSLLEGGASEVVVVLGHEHEAVAPRVKGDCVTYVINPQYALGKTTSIKAGLRELGPGVTDIMLLAVDQPRPPEIVARVVESHLAAGALVTSPRYRGRGGHPLIFSAALRAELAAITEGGQGVRAVFRAHAADVNEVRIDDPVIRLDLNTPEDYRLARARYGA